MAKSKKATKSSKSAATGTKVRRVTTEETERSSLIRDILVVVVLVLGLFLVYSAFADDNANGDTAVVEDDSKTEEKKDESSDDNKDEPAAEVTNGDNGTVTETDEAYNFTVGAGESYTTAARQAIARLAGDLTAVERVAAETKLAQDAGADLLEVGQSLELSKDNVQAAITWAKGLTGDQKAAWQPYADLVAW